MDTFIAMILACIPGADLSVPPPAVRPPHVHHVQRLDKTPAPSRVSVVDTVSGINGI